MVRQSKNTMIILDKEIFAVSPVKIKRKGKIEDSSASGFFYNHRDKFYFITNRHVVIDEGAEFFPYKLDLNLHTDESDLTKSEKFSIPLKEGERNLWLEHQPVNGDNVDVVAVPVEKADIIPHFHVMPFSKNDLLDTNRYISHGKPHKIKSKRRLSTSIQ